MSQNKQLVQTFYEEVINGGDVDKIDELVSEDFVEHEEFPGISPDRDGVKDFFRLLRSAFPDVHFTPEDVISDGELVASRFTMTGTHEGEFMGVPSSGRQVTVSGIDIIRVRDGKCVEHWGQFDALGLLQQLGALAAEAPR
ncbi:MAG TPA: ester cyclase [Gaiellaceae bacterium]